MKPLISTTPTEQATRLATKVLEQCSILSATHFPYSKADIYAILGELRV